MWRVALATTLFIVLVGGTGGSYETWAIRFRPELTITQLVKRYTHASIIFSLGLMVLAMLFGYALGVGGE